MQCCEWLRNCDVNTVMSIKFLSIFALGAAVMLSAIGVVYAKHQNRMLFVQLQALQNDRDRMEVEWGQLQLEQSTLVTHGRIERLARHDLKMTIPPADTVVMIRP